MPGIAGIIRKRPYQGIESDLRLMIEAMRYETFYNGGEYINGDAVLLFDKRGFADCMPLV
jgi:hypothetical protein